MPSASDRVQPTARTRVFTVVVGTDGGPEARAAVAAAARFPWPPGVRLRGVVASLTFATRGRPGYVLEAYQRHFGDVARQAQRVLATRDAEATVEVVKAAPTDALVETAERLGARAVVVGSRARGALRRMLLGSVGRQVVRRAPCATLVVRGRTRDVTRVVVGLDGSDNARRAVDMVAALVPPRTGRVTLVAVVEAMQVPAMPLAPGPVRRAAIGEIRAFNAAAVERARGWAASASRSLERAGWAVKTVVVQGRPLEALAAAAAAAKGDVLVIGARGVGGVERLLLGSVAEGLLDRSPISVLVVR